MAEICPLYLTVHTMLSEQTIICEVGTPDDIFNVVYVAITGNQDSIYDKSLFLSDKKQVLQIYLLKKDTREFMTFEIPLSSLNLRDDHYRDLLGHAAKQNIDNKLTEHWWVGVFKPLVKEELLENVPVLQTASQVMNESSSQLTIFYNHAPTPGTEYRMTITSSMNVHNHSVNSQDQYRLRVVSQQFYLNGVLMSNDPLLFITNCVSTVEMMNATTNQVNEDVFVRAHWATFSDSPASPVATWGVSLGIGYGPISAGISWTIEPERIPDPGLRVFMPSENVQGVRTRYGKYINKVGHEYNLETVKTRYTPQNMAKKIGIKYEFAVCFFNINTVVIPYRAITTEAVYY